MKIDSECSTDAIYIAPEIWVRRVNDVLSCDDGDSGAVIKVYEGEPTMRKGYWQCSNEVAELPIWLWKEVSFYQPIAEWECDSPILILKPCGIQYTGKL